MQMQTHAQAEAQTEARTVMLTGVAFCKNCDYHSKLGHQFCPDCGIRTNGDSRDTTTFCLKCVGEQLKEVLSERALQEKCFCPNCGAMTKALFEPIKMIGF